MKAALGIDNYPDWTARALREKIAQKYGYRADQVICGAGETEIISWIIRAFSGPGDKIAMFVPAFPIYHMTAENEGREPLYIGMTDDLDFDWDAYLAAITPDVRIAFLTNPHSPTGRLVPEARIREVCRKAARPARGAGRGLHPLLGDRGRHPSRQGVPEPDRPAHLLQGVRPWRACASASASPVPRSSRP